MVMQLKLGMQVDSREVLKVRVLLTSRWGDTLEWVGGLLFLIHGLFVYLFSFSQFCFQIFLLLVLPHFSGWSSVDKVRNGGGEGSQ